MTNKHFQIIERNTLYVGAFLTLIMAFSGWLVFYLTNSQAVMLDGFVSFISFLGILIAMKIAAIKDNRTKNMPQGRFIYESIYSFSVGSLLLIVILFVFIQSLVKIIQYIYGFPLEPLKGDIILIYAIAMLIICFGMSIYYKYRNKQINYSSEVLKIDGTKAIIDGILSGAIGLAIFLIGLVDINGTIGFLHYIGDAILVIILCVLLWSTPILIVKGSFKEIIGIATDNKEIKNTLLHISQKYIAAKYVKGEFVSKQGSSYFMYIVVKADYIDSLKATDFRRIKKHIQKELEAKYKYLLFDILFE